MFFAHIKLYADTFLLSITYHLSTPVETGIFVVGAIAIAVVIIPFIFAAAGRKKRSAQLREALNKIAAGYQTQISEYAHDDYIAIGMDAQAGYLFFLQHTQTGSEAHQAVKLSDMRLCECVVRREVVSGSSGSYQVITQIGLQLHAKQGQSSAFLEFYNRSTREQLGNEEALAQRWATLINNRLGQ